MRNLMIKKNQLEWDLNYSFVPSYVYLKELKPLSKRSSTGNVMKRRRFILNIYRTFSSIGYTTRLIIEDKNNWIFLAYRFYCYRVFVFYFYSF